MYTKAKLRELNVTELKQLARDKCVQGFSRLRKAQLVTLLSKKAPKSRCPKGKGKCAQLIEVTGVTTAAPNVKLFEVVGGEIPKLETVKTEPMVKSEPTVKTETAIPIIKLEPIN